MNQVRKKVAGQGLMPRHQDDVTCPACTPPLIATERPLPLMSYMQRGSHAGRCRIDPVSRAADF